MEEAKALEEKIQIEVVYGLAHKQKLLSLPITQGMTVEEASEVLQSIAFSELKNVSIIGVMGMATFSDDEEQVKLEFRHLKSLFDYLKATYFNTQISFSEISMGMSGDYLLAVEEGSTMVRIGSLLFGGR